MPLTERVLARLPGPRVLWIVLWALIVPLRLVELVVVLAVTGRAAPPEELTDTFLSQVGFAFVIVISLWGTPRLVRRVVALSPTLHALAPSEPSAHWFSRMTSVRGPLLLTALSVAIATPTTALEFGAPVAMVDLPLLAVMVLPIMTFVWAYGALLAGLDRLGRSELQLDRFPQDRSLGLGAVGGAATSGFWLLVVASAPLLLLTWRDLTTFAISVGFMTLIALLFGLSMVRLHGQMQAAKARYVAQTQELVAAAYAPIRTTGDLETLQANTATLNAAQSLAERAEHLLEWPIDERMVATMTVVVTGVITSLIVRFVLQAAGI